tara:strand:- start:272 stop:565 length:294 start_codon:yes stop_codon:yes gene_type:complete
MKNNIYFDGKTDQLSMRQEHLLYCIEDNYQKRIERGVLRKKNALVLIHLDGYIHSLRTYERGNEYQEIHLENLQGAISDLIRIENRIHSEYSKKEEV